MTSVADSACASISCTRWGTVFIGINSAPSMRVSWYSKGSRTSINFSFSPSSRRRFTSSGVTSIGRLISGPIVSFVFSKSPLLGALVFEKPGPLKILDNIASVVFRRVPGGLQRYFGRQRRLVRIVDASESLHRTPSRLGVETLHVARFANFLRRSDVDLDEPVRAHHRPHIVARGTVGAHRGADHNAIVLDDLGRDEPDPPDVGVTVLTREAESFRQVCADHIAIQHREPPPALPQLDRERFGDSRLARRRQTGEPDAETLPVARCSSFFDERGYLRAQRPPRRLLPDLLDAEVAKNGGIKRVMSYRSNSDAGPAPAHDARRLNQRSDVVLATSDHEQHGARPCSDHFLKRHSRHAADHHAKHGISHRLRPYLLRGKPQLPEVPMLWHLDHFHRPA